VAKRFAAAFTLLAAGAVLGACGGSSKPSYCSAVSSLEASVKALPSTNVVKNGTDALKSALTKVESDAQAVVSSAKNDFPNETAALKSSVDALSSTVKQLTSSPSAAAIVQVPGQVAAVANAAKGLSSATSSKCS